jgi:hypothetical protein
VPDAPSAYVIDVCRLCGAHAVYPFACGHRSIHERWTMALTVRPSPSARRVVQDEIRANAELVPMAQKRARP